MKRGWWILKFSVIGILAIGLFGYVVMSLWNWLIPDLFHGPVIGFWQALGLLVLSKILFGGFGRGHGWKRNPGPYAQGWKSHWKNKWSTLSPEEKEKLKQKFARCGWKMEGWEQPANPGPEAGGTSQSL
ncbi:MAG: hypothetical protein K1X47_09795 [Cyclobacteriaceae bacterium]|nr:hypothetical protein [Cyclobacteriaceae bacterium]HNE30689.1 hypothetical protein [Saprospiraceae bacterium]